MSSGGQIAGGIVGGIVGFFNPAIGVSIGAQVGILVGGLLDPPKGPTVVGPRLSDLTIQTSTYGSVIPRVYGTVPLHGNVFWLENNKMHETVVKKKSGGKGGSKKRTENYVNYATFAVGLCKGPIVGVKRIWIKSELFYDAGSSDPTTIAASNAAATGFAVYLGTDTQLPDSRMQATLGAANTPAYRGLAYIVFYDLPLAAYGETLAGAQVKVEVVAAGSNATYGADWSTHGLAGAGVYGIAQAGSILCATFRVDGGVSKSLVSTDGGISWTSHSSTVLPTSWDGYGIASDGRQFVQVTGKTNRLYRSYDGITWIEVVTPTVDGMQTITYGNGVWIVGCVWDSVLWSTDAVTWTKIPLPRSILSCGDVLWSSTYQKFYLAYGASGGENYIATSDDGLSWTDTLLGTYDNSWHRLCAIGGTIVARRSGPANETYITTDGDSWSLSAAVASVNNVVTDGSVFFGTYSGSYSHSSDGLTWTAVSTSTYMTGGAGYAVWTGSHFVWLEHGVGASDVGLVYQYRITAATTTLDDVVYAECLQSGLLTASDLETSALTSPVRGYTVASTASIRAALTQLQAAWPFDVVQRGYKIAFIPRGGSSVARIPLSDLDARGDGDSPGVQITLSREMDSQLPRRFVLKYLDYDREFDTGEQYAERLNTDAVNIETQEMAIVLTSAEAAGKAEVLLFMRWLERHDVSFSLPPTYINLEPSDVITLETTEGDVLVRLTAINYTSDSRLECKGKYASQAVYTPVALGASPTVTGPTTMPSAGLSSYVLLDVPYLHTAQADPCFLAAMWGGSGWPGGVLVRTDDAGTSWNDLQAFESPGGDVGMATNSIGSVDSRVWDKASVLYVSMLNGSLSSVTELAVLNGSNWFAYGADGRWEIIGVQTCTLLAATQYQLTDMLRGRAGTEWAMALHQAGDKLVALSLTDVTAIGMSSATIGLTREYRGITYDQDISTDVDHSFAYNGVNLECLSPVHFKAYRTPSTGNWTLSWLRRSRTDGEWRDKVDVALGETTEAYEVDFFRDDGYSLLARTLTATSPTVDYTSSQQTADFGGLTNDIWCKIYQMSSVVGRGYPLIASASYGGSSSYEATVTVPSASVISNLTDFPLLVDLSLMSASWWNSMYSADGRDIRVSNATDADIPFDLVEVDSINKTGYLFAKTNLSSTASTTIKIRVGNASDDFVSPAAANGRNAVWTNYHRVFTLGHDHADRTGNGYPAAYAPTTSMQVDATSPNVLAHQGVAHDGHYFYISDTNRLTRYDSAWNVLATNTNPVGDVGGGVNHVGDIEVVGGILYAPIESYTSPTVFSLMKIARFDASTLAYIDSVSISAQGHEAASITYCEADGYLYVASYADGSKLWKYNLTTLAYVGSVSLSSTIANIQGVTWWREAFWISSGSTKAVYRVEYDGSVRGSVYSTSVSADDVEGIASTAEGLLLLVDVIGSSGNGVVRTLTTKRAGVVEAVEFSGNVNQFEYLSGLARYTTWTMGASVRLDAKGANHQGILTYTVSGSSNNADRVSLAYRQSSDRIGLWNDTDLWLLDTISPVVGTVYRINASHNGTSGRKLYRDGSLAASAGSSTARPSASANAIAIGIESWSLAEDMSGAVGFVYLAPSQFSDDYIAAEAANLASPATFYTVTG